ncbi:MAG: alpha/beta fold hydrolase [Minisyncoccota bacterium]
MRACHHVEIVTPKKIVLNGLLLGPKKPKRIFVWLHGLNSSMFSKMSIMDLLVDTQTAVLTFNNRGHDKVSRITTTKGKSTSRRGGGAHEVFSECTDDIDGAVRFARRIGAKDVYLVGHSTGCQKSIYWASKGGKGVRGIILLAPVSDYAAGVLVSGKRVLARAEEAARSLVKKGHPHELLPENVFPWGEMADAQRFLSLYTPKSVEEIFTYVQQKKRPTTLHKVKTPILAMLAERDEFVDRPVKELYAWFLEHIYEGEVEIIASVEHSFKGAERKVASLIQAWSSENS